MPSRARCSGQLLMDTQEVVVGMLNFPWSYWGQVGWFIVIVSSIRHSCHSIYHIQYTISRLSLRLRDFCFVKDRNLVESSVRMRVIHSSFRGEQLLVSCSALVPIFWHSDCSFALPWSLYKSSKITCKMISDKKGTWFDCGPKGYWYFKRFLVGLQDAHWLIVMLQAYIWFRIWRSKRGTLFRETQTIRLH